MKNSKEHKGVYTKKGKIRRIWLTWWHKAGELHFSKRKYEEALEFYDKLLDYEPNEQKVLHYKADALHQLYRYVESIEYHAKAIRINPHNTQVLDSLQRTVKEMRQEIWKKLSGKN